MKRSMLLLLTSLLVACANSGVPSSGTNVPSPQTPAAPSQPTRLGQIEVTFMVDRAGKVSATSRPANLSSLSLSGTDAVRLVTPALSQSTFTVGSRAAGTAVRYLSATFELDNTGSTPLSNVSLVAAATPTTTAGTAVKNLLRFDGTPVPDAAALARQVVPTQSVYYDGTRPQTIEETADLQVYDPADLSALVVPSGETLLPYGFVAQNGNSRTLAAGGSGRVTLSVKVPLQATASDDPFAFSLIFEAVTDSVTRVTEGLEEQGSEDHAAVHARAQRFGATDVTVLPGSSYALDTAFPVCSVPLNAAGSGTDAFLVNDSVTGVTLDPGRKLLTKNADTRIPAAVTYASGATSSLFLNMSTTGAALSSLGGFVKGLTSGTGTVKTAACGINSADLAVRVIGRPTIGVGSNYSVVIKPDGTLSAWGTDNNGIISGVPGGTFEGVYSGTFHALAVNTGGSVLGWGYDAYGQTTVPAGLGTPLSLSAGYLHSLALKADGTVVGWGDNSATQTTVPAGLTDVATISAANNISYAVKTDGTVVSWGTTYAYPDGSSDAVPAGLNGVTAVSNGVFHHTALKADGTLVGWGDTDNGLASIPALTNVVAVTETDTAAFALKADGTVVGWGSDTAPGGPLAVPAGLTDVVAVSAAHLANHVLALRSDGTLVTWGQNLPGSSLDVPTGLTAQLP
ncbi:hypothetical protein MF271_12645 [Deinococcus sp. KNUC1210]|uniref:RCC1 domain-containing protein n=1 Tax=Deinococcus sp. KNUC1210 TaxID=2917691 RepID=UPI001EF06FC4|nr:hypothetical protein [Deinococcus sp. KNUC1210]ULH14824.1 hypothetical protein MF271_12645 [Deinococcus sp. KNUC1210]